MAIIEIPNPQLPDWLKILNTYDPTHFIPGKKVTAEEWNTLFLASVNQGNYLTETLDLLIKEYLPNTFVEQVSFEEYIANTNNTFQNIYNTASELQTQVNKANTNSEEALLLSRVAKANSEEATSNALEAINTSEQAQAIAELARTNSDEAVKTAEEAYDIAASADLRSAAAQNVASNAYTTAIEAKNIAEGIDAKATTALEISNTFKPIAEDAALKATQAISNSADALTNSQTALDNSREAMKDSSEAQSDAASALVYAQEALSKINQSIEQGGTIITVGGAAVPTIAFNSDPQLQLNSKVTQIEYSQNQTFADGSDAGAIGRLYMRFRDNTENSIVAHCQSVKYTIPVRDSAANFYVGNPTQAYHIVNKKYLEDNYTNAIASNTYDNSTNKYTGTAGLFMFDGGGKGGLFKSTAGGDGPDRFRIKKATFDDIKNRSVSNYHDAGVGTSNHCCPITPANLDYAVKQVLTNNKLNGYVYNGIDYSWTEEEKLAVRTLIGADSSGSAVTITRLPKEV